MPPPNSCCYQKHPGDAGHPGTAPFHCSSQASVTGAPAQDTAIHRGTASASREITTAPSHHPPNSPPLQNQKPPALGRAHIPQHQSTQLNLRHTEACHRLMQALLPAWQSAAEMSAPLPTQPGRKLAKRARDGRTGSGGAGTPVWSSHPSV